MERVPIWEKINLTLDEASLYTNIGVNKLREIVDQNTDLVIWNGNKRLIKRKKLDKFLEDKTSI